MVSLAFVWLVTYLFPDVVNGERNSLYLLVENKSEVNSTLKSVAGSFHDPESQALVKNARVVSSRVFPA